MVQVNDLIVRDGTVVLTKLPFPNGQHVRVTISPVESAAPTSRSIDEVRALLKGGVERFDAPFDPLVPVDDWEMLR